MSNFDNVVLYYQHPHIQTYVQNNTIRTEETATAEGPIDSLQVIMAGKGKDNVLQYFDNLGSFLEEHGSPNYALYGQPGYNVAQALKSGCAGVYVMRIMPEDATHANVVLVAKYKATGGKLEIKYDSLVVEGAMTEEEFSLKLSELEQDVDDEGYSQTPLFGLYMQGRGEYGSRFRAKFADATSYDDPDNIYKTFRLDVMEMDKSLIRKESLFGTLDPNSFDSTTKESLYLEDIVNDPEAGSGKIKIVVGEYGFSKLLEAYNELATEPIEIGQFDPIFGKTMTGKVDPLLTISSGDTGVVLDAVDGFAFSGGTDGAFTTTDKTKASARETAIEQQYIAAYNGTLDKTIKSRYTTPVSYMLDANYPDAVKRALVQLNLSRGYNMCYLDSGLLNTVQDTINWGEEIKNLGGDNILKEMHHYMIRDTEYTGKTIPMTTTHNLALNLPNHLKNVGLGEPYTMSNAQITGVVKGSFKPVVDPDDNDIKKELYALRINCYESVKANLFQRTTAITSNLTISDLLDEFNVYILNKAVVLCEEILKDKLYKLGEAEQRIAYQKDADRRLQFELGGLVRSANVEFKMSSRDEQQNIMRLALTIVYKTIVKRGIVEIYIDPRS